MCVTAPSSHRSSPLPAQTRRIPQIRLQQPGDTNPCKAAPQDAQAGQWPLLCCSTHAEFAAMPCGAVQPHSGRSLGRPKPRVSQIPVSRRCSRRSSHTWRKADTARAQGRTFEALHAAFLRCFASHPAPLTYSDPSALPFFYTSFQQSIIANPVAPACPAHAVRHFVGPFTPFLPLIPSLRQIRRASSPEAILVGRSNNGRLRTPNREALALRPDRTRTQASLALRSTLPLSASPAL